MGLFGKRKSDEEKREDVERIISRAEIARFAAQVRLAAAKLQVVSDQTGTKAAKIVKELGT